MDGHSFIEKDIISCTDYIVV